MVVGVVPRAVLVIVAATRVARAEPAAAAPPAAQSVGPRLNVSANPFLLPYRYGEIAASYAFTPRGALAVSASRWVFVDDDWEGYQWTVSVPINFWRTYSGPFIEPGLLTRTKDPDCLGCARRTYTALELLVGWHYTHRSGFNVSAAVGLAYGGKMLDSHYRFDGFHANGYLRIGFAFL